VQVTDADVQIDHIVIGVRDLDNAEPQFEDRYGLTTIEKRTRSFQGFCQPFFWPSVGHGRVCPLSFAPVANVVTISERCAASMAAAQPRA
jgi:hypothetical protein